MGYMNIPAGRRVFGVSMSYKDQYTNTDFLKSFWTGFDWTGFVKPQIDSMLGNGLGFNCIRILGSIAAVSSGAMTQSAYNACWTQIATYLQSKNAFLYPNGGWSGELNFSSWSDAQIISVTGGMLAALASNGNTNVIGCDVLQENENFSYSRTATISTGIRALTSTPLTYSTSAMITATNVLNYINNCNASMDFLDFHIYHFNGYDPIAPMAISDMNYYRTTYPTYDLFCGEHGFSQGEALGVPMDARFSASVANVFNSGDQRFRGILEWCGWGDNTGNYNDYGLLDYTGAFSSMRRHRTLALANATGGSIIQRN